MARCPGHRRLALAPPDPAKHVQHLPHRDLPIAHLARLPGFEEEGAKMRSSALWGVGKARENLEFYLGNARENAWGMLPTVLPYALVLRRDTTGTGPPGSRFPLDAPAVLGDPRLEGVLASLLSWRESICEYDRARLEEVGGLLSMLANELER
jgi:hypothetical protein